MLLIPMCCSAQSELTYKGYKLRLLHGGAFNPFYDSITFNATNDTAYIYRSVVSLIHQTNPDGSTSVYFKNKANKKLYFYHWEYADDNETAWGENDIWMDHHPDSAEVVSLYYLQSTKENFRLVIKPETPDHLYNYQQKDGALKLEDINFSREEHHSKVKQ